MVTSAILLPAHTLCSRFVALKVTVGLTVRLKGRVAVAHAGVWSLVAVMVMV